MVTDTAKDDLVRALELLNEWCGATPMSDIGSDDCVGRILNPLFEKEGYSLWQGEAMDQVGGRFDMVAEAGDERVGIEHSRMRPGDIYRDDIVDRFGQTVTSLSDGTRGILVSNVGVTDKVLLSARRKFGPRVDVLDPDRLRAWIARASSSDERRMPEVAEAVKVMAGRLAQIVARDPGALRTIEWRDLERMVAEIFLELGFDVELTPPSKDGGKDVIVRGRVRGNNVTYFIEAKHWVSGHRVGLATVSEFVRVVASKDIAGGLILSTSGYTGDVYEHYAELSKHVALGDESKVVSLCRRYERIGRGLLRPLLILDDLVDEDAKPLSRPR
jgi:restriction system protein